MQSAGERRDVMSVENGVVITDGVRITLLEDTSSPCMYQVGSVPMGAVASYSPAGEPSPCGSGSVIVLKFRARIAPAIHQAANRCPVVRAEAFLPEASNCFR